MTSGVPGTKLPPDSRRALQKARRLSHPNPALCFKGYSGLGDNIFMRPFVLEAVRSGRKVYLYTPWPELYWNEPAVRFVLWDKGMRTQHLNALRQDPSIWSQPPSECEVLRLSYRSGEAKPGASIIRCFAKQYPVSNFDFRLPVAPAWEEAADEVLQGLSLAGKQLCLVHPPMLRAEWPCPSRNPRPEYFQQLMDRYRDRFFYVAIGWLAGNHEVLEGTVGPYDAEFLHGQLHFTTIAALMQRAALTITAQNFFVPLAVSVQARVFCLFGGYVPPTFVFDPLMGLERTGTVMPVSFCHCANPRHECRKDISEKRLFEAFETFLNTVVDPELVSASQEGMRRC